MRWRAGTAAACRAELGEPSAAAWTGGFAPAKRTRGALLTAVPLLPAEPAVVKEITLGAYSILGGRKMALCQHPDGTLRKDGTFWDLGVPR